jgi:proteasome lid subunit RPN8/RPN11
LFGETEIFLSDKAFLSIILSSVEVYRNECHGVLLGFKTHGRIVVEYAIPFQSAKRTPNEVIPNWRRELKVMEILPNLIHLEKLGYFHSHPQWGQSTGIPKLSNADKEYMTEGDLEIVVAINDADRKSNWKESRSGLSGTIGKYRITIAGFYKRTSDSRIMQYRVMCPYAVGFDYTFED